MTDARVVHTVNSYAHVNRAQPQNMATHHHNTIVAMRPRTLSAVDLYLKGMVTEVDVDSRGSLSADARLRAERRHADRVYDMRNADRPSSSRYDAATSVPSLTHTSAVCERRMTTAAPPSGASTSCCVCVAAPNHFAVVPCFHMCLCSKCAASLRSCPICRQPVERIQRIYQP